jgi:hypothetical protein
MVVPLLLATGCTLDDVATTEEVGHAEFGPARMYDAADVVLKVEPVIEKDWMYRGPYPPHRWQPIVSVYGDGRVITHEPSDDALPKVFQRTISEDAVRVLAQRAIDAGVGWRSQNEAMGGYESTRFTVLTDQGPRHSLLNQHFEQDTPRDDRWMEELLRQLKDLPSILAGFTVGDLEPYQVRAYFIVYRAWGDRDYSRAPERAWPGPAFPARRPGELLSCMTVVGDHHRAVVAGAAVAKRATPWVWDGRRYAVWFRPLLPGESSCVVVR